VNSHIPQGTMEPISCRGASLTTKGFGR
jgi:hypothetical protein